MTDITAGIVQFDVKTGDISANLESATAGLQKLGNLGVQMAVLPEMWASGFGKPAMLRAACKKTPEICDTLRAFAADHGMLIAGSLPECDNGRIYNTMAIIDADGRIAGQYRKVHLFSFTGEHHTFTPGDRAVVCDTSFGPVGLMICFDLRFPEFCRTLALQGARMVVISAQWPVTRIHHWDTLIAARAIENQIFIAAANRVGQDKDLVYNGHSRIVAPDGTVLAAMEDGTGEAWARIHFTDLDILRSRFDCLGERMPHTYAL